MQLPLPWGLAALVFLIAAVATGVVALVAAVRARMGPPSVVLLSVGLGVVGLGLVIQLVRVVLYPVTTADEQCREAAITERGSAACAEQLPDRLREEFFGG